MTNAEKIEKLSSERTNLEWIKIGIGQLKTIYKAIIVGAVMWGFTFIAYNYNPPATQKQIDSMKTTLCLQARKDSIEVIVKAVKMEELNSKINVINIRQDYAIREQAEQKGILLQILSETKSVNKAVKSERNYSMK